MKEKYKGASESWDAIPGVHNTPEKEFSERGKKHV